jgi:hypothetical protein
MQIQPLVAYHMYEVLEFLVALTNLQSEHQYMQPTH